MRTSKKNEAGNQPGVRSLKIQPVIKFNRTNATTIPEITLSGRWLENLGFTHKKLIFNNFISLFLTFTF